MGTVENYICKTQSFLLASKQFRISLKVHAHLSLAENWHLQKECSQEHMSVSAAIVLFSRVLALCPTVGKV